MDERYWRFKIHAYLHDPPQKPLILMQPGFAHETIARQLAALLAPAGGLDWDLIKLADQIASGADRASTLRNIPSSFRQNPCITHPLSGEKIQLQAPLTGLDLTAVNHQVERILHAIKALGSGDPRTTFLALWRWLPSLLLSPDATQVGQLWSLLPADTRLPDHSVLGHMALTSAIAGSLFHEPEHGPPALLLLTFGPVQPFIEASRRTRDLWAASAILSELAWAMARPLADALGPDAILFPILRRQPQADQWLKELEIKTPPRIKEPQILQETPSLPNRILAIVPSGLAASLAEQCKASIQARWRAIFQEAKNRFPGWPEAFEPVALQQIERHLELTWAALPWSSARSLSRDKAPFSSLGHLLGEKLPAHLEEWLEASTQAAQQQLGYRLNAGGAYGAISLGISQLLDARKSTRTLELGPGEHGLKCSLSGVHQVVTPFPGEFERTKQWWREQIWTGERRDLRPGEALGAISLTKRFWGESRQPSTAEIAVADFKLAVLARWRDLSSEASAWVDAVSQARVEKGFSVGAVWRAARETRDPHAEDFARFDGEFLLDSARDEYDFKPEQLRKIERAARDLRRAARKKQIPPPRPYLAILHMDGDHMGRWLSGDKAPRLRQLLSPEAEAAFREEPLLRKILELPRPLAPSTHAAISQALADFSQRSVPQILRDGPLPAHLLYAGGDDVLALLPVSVALEAAWQIRLLFSGHVTGGMEGPVEAHELLWGKGHGFARDRHSAFLTMGKEASMSAGIAVFHQRAPLGRGLAAARTAEKYAKEHLGRNAFAFRILRRSGSISQAGSRWVEQDLPLVPQVQTVIESLRHDHLSPRFLAEFSRITLRLCGSSDPDKTTLSLPPSTLQAEVFAIVASHCTKDPDKRAALQGAVWRLICREGMAPATVGELRHARDLLDAVVFLAREGEDS